MKNIQKCIQNLILINFFEIFSFFSTAKISNYSNRKFDAGHAARNINEERIKFRNRKFSTKINPRRRSPYIRCVSLLLARQTISQVGPRHRYDIPGTSNGCILDRRQMDPRNSPRADSIIVVGQLAIHTWPAANLGNVPRYSNCPIAVLDIEQLTCKRVMASPPPRSPSFFNHSSESNDSASSIPGGE